MTGRLEMAPGEWGVLGAVAEGPTHGFAVAQLLEPSGALGRVWTLPRPAVYQALKKLSALGLVAEKSAERSERGPVRTILVATPAGKRALRKWLAEPVDHVRDVRSLLLLKLALLDRSGADPATLVDAQRRRIIELAKALETQREAAHGFDRVLVDWRLTSAQATLRFLDALCESPTSS